VEEEMKLKHIRLFGNVLGSGIATLVLYGLVYRLHPEKKLPIEWWVYFVYFLAVTMLVDVAREPAKRWLARIRNRACSQPAEQVHGKCSHGQCLNHVPRWKRADEKKLVPNPGLFGKTTYWTLRCCGKPMGRYKEVRLQECSVCGRVEEDILHYEMALCSCCGHSEDADPPSMP
jgi:hypothetical protein